MVSRISKLLCILIALAASPVWACGVLEKATPKVGSTLSKAPTQLVMHFSQNLVPADSSITLKNANGQPVKLSPLSNNGPDSLAANINEPLDPGRYKVEWSVMWKDCGNATQGSYPFTVQP